ncbi:MAG: non-canonical purine NTP pyrophosphatase [Leptospirales bacterium]
MKPFLLATGNVHKLQEFRDLLPPVVPLEMTPEGIQFPPETGETYFQNAFLKATACFPAPGHFILADDSGLEVDALDGRPGLLSARYAGVGASGLMNCQALAREMKEIPPERRAARFRCVLAVLDGDRGSLVVAVQGIVEGRLARGILGDGGFGYDPLFIPDGYQVTFGILPEAIKNSISHRAQAVTKLLKTLGIVREVP